MTRKDSRIAANNRSLVRLSLLIAVVGALVIGNVLFVTGIGYHVRSGTNVAAYSEVATTSETILARRGYILDRNGNIIAQDSVAYNLIAILDNSRPSYEGRPAYVPYEQKREYADKLSSILGCDSDTIYGYLDQNLYQTEFGVWGRGLSSATRAEIENLGLYGLEFEEQSSRNYPLGAFASHLIGYTRYSSDLDAVVGEMGIESLLNAYLSGKNGKRVYSQDANGYALLGTQLSYTAAANGNNVVLTIDKQCQEALELLMQQTTKQFNCKSCWGGVMEVKTGKMLAWGGSPSFNPNEMEISNYNDLGASVTYEPGSTMKTFTYAAAIDSGKYNGSTKYNSGPFYIDYTSDGRLKRANSNKNYGIIRNFNNANWGKITYDQAYCRSLNTGIADIVTNVINPDILSNYLDAFGFFEPVNTDGVKDVSGVRNMDTGLDAIATGYGQSSSVTALQMFQAYSAIFNEGTMMKPYFVDYIQDSYTGEIIYEGKPTVVGNPIKPETARQVVKLMKKVVTDPTYGTAKWYKISGMSLAIKTGTAEVFENGRYGSNVITSVACGMPANDPQIFIYFCYKAKYNSDMHYKTDPIKRFFRKVIKVTNLNNDLTGDEDDIPEEQTEEDDLTITKLLDTVPSLVNHTTDFAKSTLAGSGVKLIILGTGDTILKQYPEADTELTKRQKIFLMTSLTKIKMPDMTGWSRKDVNQFWEITGIGVTIEGAGYVVEQSIPKGTTLENTDTIRVVLSNESN